MAFIIVVYFNENKVSFGSGIVWTVERVCVNCASNAECPLHMHIYMCVLFFLVELKLEVINESGT